MFQSKQAMNKQHHLSLNRQIIVVLEGIICFSVQFWDNSLIVLKYVSGLFFHKEKGIYKGFPVTEIY